MAAKEVYLKITHDGAIPWMHRLVTNTLANRTHPTTITFYEELAAWDEAMSNPLTLQDIMDLPPPEPKVRAPRSDAGTKRKRKPKSGLSRQDKANPLICNEHPTYGGVRIPRKDCTGCWAVYKALHPMDYDKKRREFLLAQKRKTSSTEG